MTPNRRVTWHRRGLPRRKNPARRLAAAAGLFSSANFVRRLGELGWVEGRTVAIEYRRTDARKECFAEIAAEFVRRKVDTLSGTAIATAKQETSTIPIVFAIAVDPERN
jgi:putative ABC transport system substrate-binding protein